MAQVRRLSCTTLLTLMLLLPACTQVVMVRPTSGGLAPGALSAAPVSTQWWEISFIWAWNREQSPDWHLDALTADQICFPVLTEFMSDIKLWRFHRRAAPDATGHRLRLLVYADAETAERMYTRVRETSLLQWMERDGRVELRELKEFANTELPAIAHTSDGRWPAEIQVSWPYFIMGVSQSWLTLIQAVRERSPVPDGVSVDGLIDHYQDINARVNALWRDQGQHAYLHHLNGVFGYQPLVIKETNLKRF